MSTSVPSKSTKADRTSADSAPHQEVELRYFVARGPSMRRQYARCRVAQRGPEGTDMGTVHDGSVAHGRHVEVRPLPTKPFGPAERHVDGTDVARQQFARAARSPEISQR